MTDPPMTDPPMPDSGDPTRADLTADDALPEAPPRSIRKIVVRIIFVVGAEKEAAFGPFQVNAELLALGSMWLLWIGAQGLLTASLVPGLAVRHGVVAFLGPASITSVVPGPSDLPIRYQMLTSWGRTTAEATLAVAAGGIFSIGVKLVLPVIAALGLVISDAPISGTLRTVVVICLLVGLGVAVLSVVLGSEKRTEQAGRLIEPIWGRVLRMLRKPEPADLPARMVAARADAVGTLHDRWLVASWATMLTAATKFALLLMTLRFIGVDDDVLPWTQVFVVFALVQGLTVFPITAGDAGVSEIAYIGMLTAAAGQEWVNQITAAILIFRILTWLLIIPVGLAVLGFWRHQLRRNPPDVASRADGADGGPLPHQPGALRRGEARARARRRPRREFR